MGRLFRREKQEPTWDDAAVEAKKQAAASYVSEQDDTQFPFPLLRSVVSQALIASAIVLVCSCLALATKHLSYLVGFLFAIYLAYNCVNLVFDYKHGFIHQRVLLCTSVSRNLIGRQIIMQDTSGDTTKIHEFIYPKKGNCPFIESGVYIIYTHDKEPRRIVAWMQT